MYSEILIRTKGINVESVQLYVNINGSQDIVNTSCSSLPVYFQKDAVIVALLSRSTLIKNLMSA